MEGMEEIVEEFLVESRENVDDLDRELVELEKDPASGDLLANIFRNLHTLKGTAGFLALSHLESLAHAAENLLSELREGRIVLRTDIMDALLLAVDEIRIILDTIEESGSDGENDHADLVATLHRLAEAESDPATAAQEDQDDLGSKATERVAVEEPEPARVSTQAKPPPQSADSKPAQAAASSHQAAETSIRVDVGLLDRLMNLVGELVLARNQVLQYQTNASDESFHSTSTQLDLITTELQEGVMKTRMQPIGSVWAKLPRLVRDLSAACGKRIRLEMEGEETELDKTLIEAIKDPLTHIVRNAVDHGIEEPEVRVGRGKDETGVLKLRAFHEGGQVIIEISDDGAGLDLDRIRDKAVANGLLSADRAAALGERDAAMLVFQPGFSTAAEVTNVSGRGVGMDVVKTNVEKIGGTLDIVSQPGEGMTLTLKIPLTLAIIPALIVSCEHDRFLIPQINLVEVLRVDGKASEARVQTAGDAEVLRLRGNLLPIVHLRDVLGIEHTAVSVSEPSDLADLYESDSETATLGNKPTESGYSIVVVQADTIQFGLVVDEINDTEEIVVKPLSPHLKHLGAYAGTTIMGDGAVSLILDVMGLARLGGSVRTTDTNAFTDGTRENEDEKRASSQMVLVCMVGTQRIGIPLALVSRLEEFDPELIELAGGHEVIQYRDKLLRLIRVGHALGVESTESESTKISVLVHEAEAGLFGFVVDQIIDVFEADLDSGEPSEHHGLTMSGVIGRRVTDLLDIDELVAGRLLTTRATAGVAA